MKHGSMVTVTLPDLPVFVSDSPPPTYGTVIPTYEKVAQDEVAITEAAESHHIRLLVIAEPVILRCEETCSLSVCISLDWSYHLCLCIRDPRAIKQNRLKSS